MLELMTIIDNQRKNMNREDFARALGVNPSTYYRQVKGGVNYLDTEVARKYISYFSAAGQASIVKAILEHLADDNNINVDVSLS